MKNPPTLIVAFLVLLCGLTAASGSETATQVEHISIKTAIPQLLKPLHMTAPEARFVVQTDKNGALEAVLCTWATHTELLEPAYQVIEKSISEKKQEIVLNKPFHMTVNFVDYEQLSWKESQGNFMPQGGTSIDGAKARFYSLNSERFVYKMSEIKDLDQPLKVTSGSIVIVSDKNGEKAKGNAVLEYYVDHTGHPQFPQILESSGNLVSQSALLSLAKLTFDQPTTNGQPTYVKVKQPFNFN